jgi:hypothetical protein
MMPEHISHMWYKLNLIVLCGMKNVFLNTLLLVVTRGRLYMLSNVYLYLLLFLKPSSLILSHV